MKYEFSNVVNHKAHQGKMTKTKDQTHQEHMLNGTLWVFCQSKLIFIVLNKHTMQLTCKKSLNLMVCFVNTTKIIYVVKNLSTSIRLPPKKMLLSINEKCTSHKLLMWNVTSAGNLILISVNLYLLSYFLCLNGSMKSSPVKHKFIICTVFAVHV